MGDPAEQTWVLLVAGEDGEPVPCGWICEDCDFFAFTENDAFAHSDEAGHSLAPCPLWMPVRR